MPGNSSKYADKTEIPDSEDEFLTSSPDDVSNTKVDTSTKATKVLEVLVKVHPASAMEPVDEEEKDSDSITLLKDEKILEERVPTNDQPVLSAIAQQSTAIEEQAASDEDHQESSDLMRNSPLVARREDQVLLADDMLLDTHSTTTLVAEAPAASEEPAPVEYVQDIPAVMPIDGQVPDSSSSARVEDQASLAEDMQLDDHPGTISTAEAYSEAPVTQNESPTHTAPPTHDDLSHAGSSSPTTKTTPQKNPKSLKSDLATTLSTLTAERDALLATFAALPTISPLLQTPTPSTPSNSPPSNISDPSTVLPIAKDLITTHIKLLHTYNEIKDIGQGLMGLLADQRGVRIKEVQEEFGVGGKD
ncbi:hypothetical protein BU16DRAFT_545258 [Lophium mytilinum]|uniref:Swi5-domain-containing protein n=1 Tax=Lophium mytilinum TaxID=390894 RepID=A0A6A6Q8F1_9PEZI|nr:hypothetical protein BU16DRAFT_545258 [Lophium mytilinum]